MTATVYFVNRQSWLPIFSLFKLFLFFSWFNFSISYFYLSLVHVDYVNFDVIFMAHLHLNELLLICDMWLNKITYLLTYWKLKTWLPETPTTHYKKQQSIFQDPIAGLTQTDTLQKQKMKIYADQKGNAQERKITSGEVVLMKQHKQNKLSTKIQLVGQKYWDKTSLASKTRLVGYNI